MSRRRATVLILIHVAIAVHIIQWKLTGKTVSPVEPSEAMQTLEAGRVNAGFIFLCAAVLLTLVFGRFFCGWACHVVALQDFCGWLMKKCGIRPRLFRSRLLVFVPVIFAFYMFLWPTFRRLILAPVVEAVWPAGLAHLGAIRPFPGFSNHLIEENFWQTFPSWLVAVPFFLVCGFLTVYFLGAKGFCTYGCPYGGIFGPVDRLAPGTIKVDQASCEQCGHCTATCTSNVRVHEEIHRFGQVVDPGCMKCMDCVSVCPNDALSFSFSRPSLFKGKARSPVPAKKYDVTLAEDLFLAGVFLAAFLSVRGTYGIPLLMALGIAPCTVFLTWKLMELFRRPDVTLHRLVLRRQGSWRLSGRAAAGVAIVTLALMAHTGWVRYHLWRGDVHDRQVRVPREVVFNPAAGTMPEEAVRSAEQALFHYGRGRSFRDGGIGLLATPGIDLRIAWLHLVVGNPGAAEAELRATLERHPDSDVVAGNLGEVLILQGEIPEAIELFRKAITLSPENLAHRTHLVRLLLNAGRVDEALDQLREAVAVDPENARTRAHLGSFLLGLGRPEEAVDELRRAVESAPDDADIRNDLAHALMRAGRPEAALEEIERAVELAPDDARIQAHREAIRQAQGTSPLNQ